MFILFEELTFVEISLDTMSQPPVLSILSLKVMFGEFGTVSRTVTTFVALVRCEPNAC